LLTAPPDTLKIPLPGDLHLPRDEVIIKSGFATSGNTFTCVTTGVQMMDADNMTNRLRGMRGTSPENYCRMDEREKDIEIQKAVDRLQKRIQAILYLLEQDTPQASGAEAGRTVSKLP
jgi:hypothetical protein